MIQIINDLASTLTIGFFVKQVITIAAIWGMGFLTVFSLIYSKEESINGKSLTRYSLAGAFPAGLSLVMLVGYCMLTLGIPYKAYIMILLLLAIISVVVIRGIKRGVLKGLAENVKYVTVALILVIILASVACSGVLRMSVSNDSLYYFWQYPRAIVYYGGLRDQFDNFLTDTGLGASVIGTLPFLFGFGESFGIQEFFHMSFLLCFGNCMYEYSKKILSGDGKKALFIAGLGTLLLALCTPAVILAHWAMSNMYFMEFFFICLAFALDCESDKRNSKMVILALLIFAVSVIRVEGGIFVLFMILAASLRNIDSRKLALCILPVVVLQSLYQIRIFTAFTIDHPYIFLTKEKAIIQFAAYIAVILYLVFFSGWLKSKLSNYLGCIIILGLLLVNLVLLVFDSSLYIANIKAFAGNLTGQSGWGVLPYISVGLVVIIACLEFFINRFSRARFVELLQADIHYVAYWIFNAIGFLLVTLAVSYARGDDLNIDTGDSGNRVLLQIVPIIVMASVLWIIDNLQRKDKEGI